MRQFMAVFLILSLFNVSFWPNLALATATPGPTPTTSPNPRFTTSAADDESACSDYYRDLVRAKMDGTCRAFDRPGQPTPTVIAPQVHASTMTYDSSQQCNQEFRSRWGELAQHCDAIRLGIHAHNGDIATTSVLIAATLVCASACFCGNVPACAATAYSGLMTACTIGGAAAAATELGTLITLISIGDVPLSADTIAAGGVASLGGVVANNVGQGGHPCYATAIMAAGAVYRGANVHRASANIDEERRAARALASFSTAPQTGGSSAPDTPTRLPDGSSSNSNIPNRTASRSQNLPSNFFGPSSEESYREFMSGSATAAPIDPRSPYGKVANSLDRSKLSAALSQLGLSDSDILKKAKNQESLSAAMGSLPYSDANITGTVAKMEDAAKAGQLAIKLDDGGSVMSAKGGSGGGKSGAGSKNTLTFGGLGSLSGSSGGGTSETSFTPTAGARAVAPPAANEDDIWHAGWGGSIFQIVTNKLNQTRDRVDRLEWITPLNRALVGLPAKRDQNSGGNRK